MSFHWNISFIKVIEWQCFFKLSKTQQKSGMEEIISDKSSEKLFSSSVTDSWTGRDVLSQERLWMNGQLNIYSGQENYMWMSVAAD